ncbi:MAG: VirK family protein [Gammaproteobacteria bacterium]
MLNEKLSYATTRTTYAFAAPHKTLTSYEQLRLALRAGDQVIAVVDVDKCVASHPTETKLPGAAAGFNFDVFDNYKVQTNYKAQMTIATAFTHVTQHSKFGFVQDYVRLRIFEDNSAEIMSAYLNPQTFVPYYTVSYACQVGEGVLLYA